MNWVDIKATSTPIGRFYEFDTGVATGARPWDTSVIRVPSVTTVLSNTDYDALKHFRAKYPGVLEAAAHRGSQVHTLIERYLTGREEDPQSPVYPLFRQVKPLLKKLEVHFMESPMVSLKHGVAGRGDCGATFEGVPVFIDWKSKARPSNKLYDYPLQLAAYIKIFSECYPDYPVKFDRGLIVSITPSTIDFTLMEPQDIDDNWGLYLQRLHMFNQRFPHEQF